MSRLRAVAVSFLTVSGLLLLATLPGCDDGGDRGPTVTMIHGVVQSGGHAVFGATVYLAVDAETHTGGLWWQDSTSTNSRGAYSFTDLDPAVHHVYAARRAQQGSGVTAAAAGAFEMISPLSDSLAITARDPVLTADLDLQPVLCEGSFSGRVLLAPEEPAAGAIVTVQRLEGFAWTWIADTTTNEQGQYAFPAALCTGTYQLMAAYEPGGDFPAVATILDVWNDGVQAQVLPDLRIGDTIVRKPAIYIYPEETTRFDVRLRLPASAQLIASEPPYGNGWEVTIAPGGLIEREYRYLFYELRSARTPALDAGWCVSRQDLPGRLPALLAELGLNERETADFLDYWLPALQGHPWWQVQPALDQAIEPLAGLEVTPRPDSARRVWVYFRSLAAPVGLPAPSLPAFRRDGTTLVEWGGAVLGE